MCRWSENREKRSYGGSLCSRGFPRSEIERLVAENAVWLLRSWHEYFGA